MLQKLFKKASKFFSSDTSKDHNRQYQNQNKIKIQHIDEAKKNQKEKANKLQKQGYFKTEIQGQSKAEIIQQNIFSKNKFKKYLQNQNQSSDGQSNYQFANVTFALQKFHQNSSRTSMRSVKSRKSCNMGESQEKAFPLTFQKGQRKVNFTLIPNKNIELSQPSNQKQRYQTYENLKKSDNIRLPIDSNDLKRDRKVTDDFSINIKNIQNQSIFKKSYSHTEIKAEDQIKFEEQDHFNSQKTISSKETLLFSRQQQETNIQDQRNLKFQQNIQAYLDDVIQFFIAGFTGKQERNRKFTKINQIELLLHSFKDKYKIMNERCEMKWRLLLAHCKQRSFDFSRAAVLYQQILQKAKQNPKQIPIPKQQIYHKQANCFVQIRQWNKGIQKFCFSIQIYRQKNMHKEYAECMNNLGRLFLLASQYSFAQQCFFRSYQIKKQVFGKTSPRLISTLINLYQCNVFQRNYEQALRLLQGILKIAITLPKITYQYIQSKVLRKKAKILFLMGNFNKAYKLLQSSQEKLQKIQKINYKFTLQFAQISNLRGLLKLEEKKYNQSKQFFEIALFLFLGYYSKQNIVIKTLKRNIALIDKYLSEEKQYIIKAFNLNISKNSARKKNKDSKKGFLRVLSKTSIQQKLQNFKKDQNHVPSKINKGKKNILDDLIQQKMLSTAA